MSDRRVSFFKYMYKLYLNHFIIHFLSFPIFLFSKFIKQYLLYMEYYAILSQGDEIPLLSEENDGGGTRASYMLIFKVASILCCMFIQIPIPKVSFNTPPPTPSQQPKFLAT